MKPCGVRFMNVSTSSDMLEQGCPTRGPRATLWPTMLSGVARVEIKAVKKQPVGFL